jgi:acyl dehydratase
MTTLLSRDTLPGLVGTTLGPAAWMEVTQERINEFANASGDHQWIHVDVERARTGPFGATIAHGLLTLSMIAALNQGMFKFDGFKMGLNYGYEKVRFPSTVPVGSRLRVTAKILSFEPVGQMFQTIIEYSVEREGADKPACVAQMVFRHVL